jgi:NAD(P)-dependent dehydrogenase (short-subunit alcohol dehydrogenase family)
VVATGVNEGSTELSERVAVVTGGGTGIGRAIALELARRGARLVVVGRRGELLGETARRIESEGGSASALEADIRGVEWLAALDEVAPTVDVLVSNAAAFATFAPVEHVSEHEIAAVLDTDLGAVLRLTAHVLPGMKQRGHGRIVNIGSLAGSLGAAGQVAYAAAKSGLSGLTRSVALEGGRFDVTCNLLELGLVATSRIEDAIDAVTRAKLLASTPVGRMGTPEEVAAVVAFLVGPNAGFVTGATLPVSGGLGLGLYGV